MQLAVSDLAFTYLKELPPHKSRRNSQTWYYTGTIDVTTTTGKGLGLFLDEFLCLIHPDKLNSQTKWDDLPNAHYYTYGPQMNIPELYYTKPSHSLKTIPFIAPFTFVDSRPQHLIDHQTTLNFIPGQPYPQFNISGELPIWCNLEQTRPHAILLHTHTVVALWQIGTFWHIMSATGRRPRNMQETAAGVLEAIGLGYLTHPLLPPNPLTGTFD